MNAKVVRADYDALSQLANKFGHQAEQVRLTLQQLNREVDGLQAGDWLGHGAQAFYAEMNSDILPTLNRLASALETAGDVTRQVNRVTQQAEKEAAALLRGEGSGNGAGAALGAAASPGAAGGADGAGGLPDGVSAFRKPGDGGGGGRPPSKKPGATVSARSKAMAKEYLGEIRQLNPELAKAIEKDPALRSLLEQATRAGYITSITKNGPAELDVSEREIWLNPKTTAAQFKMMAAHAIDNPRILSNLDQKAAAAIKKNPALLERVLNWGDYGDPPIPTNLEMGTGPGANITEGRNRMGTTISLDPKDPAGSLARALQMIERDK